MVAHTLTVGRLAYELLGAVRPVSISAAAALCIALFLIVHSEVILMIGG